MDNEGLLKWADDEVKRIKEMLTLAENHVEMLQDIIEEEAPERELAAKEEQFQEAMGLMRERLSLYMLYWENSSLQRGKAEGMQEALIILMEVMK